MNVQEGIELIHTCDVPSGSGLGTSSSFLVGLMKTLTTYRGLSRTKQELAYACIHLEQNVLKEVVGYQDTMAAAYGGLNILKFQQALGFQVEPVGLDYSATAELEAHLMLYYTKLPRSSHDVASSYMPAIAKKLREQQRIVELAEETIDILHAGKFIKLGRILHQNWLAKRRLSDKVSVGPMDEYYQKALAAGAAGGKYTGAGGGGSLLLCVEPSRRKQVRETMARLHLIEIPFKFVQEGASVIYNGNGLDNRR